MLHHRGGSFPLCDGAIFSQTCSTLSSGGKCWGDIFSPVSVSSLSLTQVWETAAPRQVQLSLIKLKIEENKKVSLMKKITSESSDM